ncbi:hypothetical protein F443_00680 [Phytophthora nicotianae P1569]|uniref:Uncharacterized protein n=1 Tax=Phytophthora nicotianae P1569 TaxID=1317065 RepID=V9FZM9_PHYNI|nr:hypothetical protein F443_00680 [Phytophthora nicotianae P1569]
MELWRELYKQGWTPKPSTGLSNDHRYVRPGRSVRGKDGVDFFTEEEEKTGDQVDYEAEFNMYDSDRFMSALAKNEWSCEAEDDDPNPCSAEVEIDEANEVETEDHIDEVMNVELEEEGERSGSDGE